MNEHSSTGPLCRKFCPLIEVIKYKPEVFTFITNTGLFINP